MGELNRDELDKCPKCGKWKDIDDEVCDNCKGKDQEKC